MPLYGSTHFSNGVESSLPILLMSLFAVNRNGLKVETDAEVLDCQDLNHAKGPNNLIDTYLQQLNDYDIIDLFI